MTQPMTAERLADLRAYVAHELQHKFPANAVHDMAELLAHIDHLTEEHETYRRDAGETWRACLEAAGVDFSDLEIAQAECDCYGPKPSDTIRGKVNELRSEVSRLAAEREEAVKTLEEANNTNLELLNDTAELAVVRKQLAALAAENERLRAGNEISTKQWGERAETWVQITEEMEAQLAAAAATIATLEAGCRRFGEQHAGNLMTIERQRSVLREILAGVACENAGNSDNPYAYFWQKNWDRLKAAAARELEGT